MNPQPAFNAMDITSTEQFSARRVRQKTTDDRHPKTATLQRWPALLRGYRDLASLRHEYPLILVEHGSCRGIESLSDVVNALLQRVAPRGPEGERMRRQVLRLEREIRSLVLRGETGLLSQMWSMAATALSSAKGKESGEDDLDQARVALDVEGEVIGCGADTADRVMRHLWRRTHGARLAQIGAQLRELTIRLNDVLRSDDLESDESRQPKALKHAFGNRFDEMIDFEAMSRTLRGGRPHGRIPARRRERIEWALGVLREEKFYGGENDRYEFAFTSCTEALSAFNERSPRMADLVKAVRIAALEIENRCRDELHEEFFENFDTDSLTAEDMRWFPSYFVSLRAHDCDAENRTELIEILSSDLPIKVVFHVGRLFHDADGHPDALGIGAWRTQLASMAVNLGSAFVMETTTSNLSLMAGRMADGLANPGSALFCLFSPGEASDIPAYPAAAAAIESRVFPAMVFDPDKGETWADCFSLGGNPQPDRDWPIHTFSYEDDRMQAVTEEIPFTAVDFLATDAAVADALQPVPRHEWNEAMVPLAEAIHADPARNGPQMPFLLAVDSNDRLQRVPVPPAAVRYAHRIAGFWRRLQELGGINNSYARRAVDEAREKWEAELEALLEESRAFGSASASQATVEEPVESSQPAPEVEPEAEVHDDEAWIETVRCTSCNECVNRNNRMFKYNDNKQAYIADLHAGTYRDLVEAAESCKVAIIHPGKPWNPEEPNLEDLLARAEPFR